MNKYNDREGTKRSLFYMACVLGMMLLVARHMKPQVHTTPEPQVHIQMGYMGLPSPPKCEHLYNVARHKEWAECMGVGYNHE